MKRILTGGGTIVGLVAALSSALPAQAIAPAPTDLAGTYLQDGDVISAMQSAGDPDLYIIKLKPHTSPLGDGDLNGYKRLFLNPAIFSFYGHLGGWARVKQVTTAVRDSFETSGLFRNCETGNQKVYATEVTGEDDGILHHVEMTGDQAVAEDYRFFDKVFCINSREESFYPRSITNYRRLADIPRYGRGCVPRPACLDQNPACAIGLAPGQVWCPRTTPTGQCSIGGCSGQLCTDRLDSVTTCEYRASYACYPRHGRCERQSNGMCGWTPTAELTTCLQNPPPIY